MNENTMSKNSRERNIQAYKQAVKQINLLAL